MDWNAARSRRRTSRALHRELELVETAIAMVALGGSSHVSIGGLRHANRVLDRVNGFAFEAGVRLVSLSGAETVTTGIAVERSDAVEQADAGKPIR